MSETIAAIIGALFTAILGFAWFFYQRRQGTKITIERYYQNQQLQFSTEYIRKNLEMRYMGEPVDNVVLTQLRIKNKGDTVEKPVTLEIHATPRQEDDTLEFFTADTEDPLDITTLDYEGTTGAPIIRLSRPYFNSSISQTKEKVLLYIISNIDLNFEVKGGGLGWYAEYYDGSEPPNYARSAFAFYFWTFLLFVVTIVAIYMVRALIPFVLLTSTEGLNNIFYLGGAYGIGVAGILGIILSNIKGVRSNMGRRLYYTLDELT